MDLIDAPDGDRGVYALDIETDTSIDGFDPTVAPIVAIALATGDHTTVFAGDEATLFRDVDAALRTLPAGALVTWNGSSFDLPFIAERARRVDVRLALTPDQRRWDRHEHVDAYLAYRDVGASLRISCALKSIARLVGLDPIEVDRSDIGALTDDELSAYVASDAEVTRVLALRRRGLVGSV